MLRPYIFHFQEGVERIFNPLRWNIFLSKKAHPSLWVRYDQVAP
jgi:hypothetical protein